MGRLYYGYSADAIEMPDRILSHLRVLTTTKLRRSESFSVTWRHADGTAEGRSTIWLHCSIPLRFEFDSAEAEVIDRAYLESLAQSASSSGGLTLDLTEPTSLPAPIDVTRSRLERAA
jgi:hypothetical protein